MIFILIIMIVFTIFTTINFKDNSNNELNNSSKPMNEKPNDNGNNMIGEPPEKPDSDKFNNDNNQKNKPDGNNNQNNMIDSMPSMPDNIKMNNTSSNLSTKEYIIIIIQASIISLIIIYLIMSKLNKKTFKEIFENKDKLIIYFLLTLILTASIFYLDNKIISKENNNMMNDKDNHINNNENISYSSVKEITSDEGIVIGGKNSVSLDNVKLTDNNTKLNGKSTTYKNIFLYQSMSVDAEDGISSFTSKNSEIITNKSDTFYVTNTNANITLENNSIINNDSSSNFLRVQKDSWWNNGENGGNVTLKRTKQSVKDNIEIDSISTLKISLNNNSYYEGEINNNNEAKNIELSLDKSSKIKLTSDSYITSLDNKDESNSNIYFNGYKLYVNGKVIN